MGSDGFPLPRVEAEAWRRGRSRSWLRWLAGMGALALVALSVGCTLVQLQNDLDDLNTISDVTGTVRVDHPSGAPIAVVMVREIASARPVELVDGAYLAAPGKYLFPLLPGRYQVIAFEDQNRNQKLDPGERGARSKTFAVGEKSSPEAPEVSIGSAFLGRFPNVVDRRLVRFGMVADLEDARFSEEAGTEGVWRPLLMMQEYQPGLYLLEQYSADKTPVLFVHGMSGYGQEFRALIGALDRRRFQPWLMTYPSGLRLEKLANFLSESLAQMNTLHPIQRMCIVAHSMGGVVTRRALSLHAARFSPPFVRALVTIASPLGGIAAAEYGVEFSPGVVPSWRDLVPPDAFMQSLYKEPLPSSIEYHLLAAVSETAASDGVVPIQSQLRQQAQGEASTVHVFVGESHTGVLEEPQVIAYVNHVLDNCRAGKKTTSDDVRPDPSAR